MSQDFDHNVNWHDLEDTSSEDEGESGSGNESGDSNDHKHEEKKKTDEQHQEIRQRGKYNQGKYRDNYKRKEGKFEDYNRESNYEKFYRNDPDFFVRVIKLEEPPHEIGIKFRTEDKDGFMDLSRKEVESKLQKFGVEEIEWTFKTNNTLKISIFVRSDSQTAVQVYSNLYDRAAKLFPGYIVNVYYERDRAILEKHADEAAEEYYKEQNEKKGKFDKQKYNKDYHHDKKYEDEHYDASSALAGFHTGSGPHKYFNKRKEDVIPISENKQQSHDHEETNASVPITTPEVANKVEEEEKVIKTEAKDEPKDSKETESKPIELKETSQKVTEEILSKVKSKKKCLLFLTC